MEFREHAWQQQLHHMRLLHGAGAEITERSLPTTPPVAIREMLRQSGHPHQLEPLLLTLCKPVNTDMRQRFAGAQGELTLIEKSLSKEDLATDLKVAVHGQIIDAADGILYPTQDVTTSFEVWLRVEMLDVLATMISEGLVRSLVPEMQLKLVHDCLDITTDKEQHELVRLYAFVTALQAAKSFQPIRGTAAADPQFLDATLRYLNTVTAGHSPASIFIDPCEHMRALNACIEALYLAAVGGHQGGDPSLKTSAPYIPVADLVAPVAPSPALKDPAVAAAVAKALQQTCCLLADRERRMVAAAAAAADKAAKKQQKAAEAAAAAASGKQTATSSSSKEGEEQERELPPELQEQLDAIPTSFEDNWRQYLDAADAGGTLEALGSATAAMAAALLQLLAQQVEGSSSSSPWQQHLTAPALQQLASTQQPLLRAAAAITAAAAGLTLAPPPAAAAGAEEAPEGALTAATAVVSLPGYSELLAAVYARRCTACTKREEEPGQLKKCGQCGCAVYCSQACQKADWKAGHKAVCKQLAEKAAAA